MHCFFQNNPKIYKVNDTLTKKIVIVTKQIIVKNTFLPSCLMINWNTDSVTDYLVT